MKKASSDRRLQAGHLNVSSSGKPRLRLRRIDEEGPRIAQPASPPRPRELRPSTYRITDWAAF